MESCNITLKGSCNPGSILIDNEKEEPCLFIINMVVRGTLHFETNSLWFSGRPSLDTRVRTKISLFLFLRFDFASLMCLHPSIGMILSVEHTHKARRLPERVCRGIQEGGETITLWPQSNQDSTAPPGPYSGPEWKWEKEIMSPGVSIHCIFWREQNKTWETEYLTVLTLGLPGFFVTHENSYCIFCNVCEI